MNEPTTKWLRLREAAEYCACSQKSIRRAALSGRLKGYSLGRQWRFTTADLDAWLKSSAEPLPFVPKAHAS